MFQDIQKNKIKSGFIIALFASFLTFIVYYISMAFDLGPISIVIALVFSIISTWSSYYYSDKIVLTLNGARPATEEENQKLVHILDGLMVSSGLSDRPKLYIMEDRQPNAFATGRNPSHAVICVTTGLLNKLDYYEIEAVLAHELSHIKNYDILLSAIVTVMVGLIVMLSDLFTRNFLWRSNKKSDRDNTGGAIFILIGFILLILSPIFAKLMQLAVSRKRELLADATAVEMTRNPDGLIQALEKLGSDSNELKVANTSTENMFIVNPFRDVDENGKKKKRKGNWFSTHPSIEERIEAIKNIK